MGMWTTIPDEATITATVIALQSHGIDAGVVGTKEEVKKKLLEFLPKGAEVFTLTSMTLEAIGVLPNINESGEYSSVRKQLLSMNRETQGREMRKLGAAPDWAVGSVQAVTMDGEVMIASNTGSQQAAYVYGAGNVIWVVGAQKIVSDSEQGTRRIYEYCLPLESDRMSKQLGRPFQSSVSKILVIKKEVKPHRIQLILVKEVLGF
jgi:formyltetrahydrofolate synthetase